MNSLLFYPARSVAETPVAAGLRHRELAIETADGEILHGWWIETPAPSAGHALLLHGNAGNIGDRIVHARLLCEAGLDVLLFDYRGYGRSTGRPTEDGTYSDARGALAVLGEQPAVDPRAVVYVGESLGGAVALALALEAPPRGLVLQSTFTSVRALARLHYPFVPTMLVPNAYPSRDRIARLRAPLLILHGERDELVPVSHAQALFGAASPPKRIHVFRGLGHNDLIPLAGRSYVEVIGSWLEKLSRPPARSA